MTPCYKCLCDMVNLFIHFTLT